MVARGLLGLGMEERFPPARLRDIAKPLLMDNPFFFFDGGRFCLGLISSVNCYTLSQESHHEHGFFLTYPTPN